jgi:hypothetical protein
LKQLEAPHCVNPVLQANPEHAPPVHVAVAFATVVVHAVTLDHSPFGSQVWKPVPTHSAVAGTQIPTHAPATHACFKVAHEEPMSEKCPSEPHCCGCSPLH